MTNELIGILIALGVLAGVGVIFYFTRNKRSSKDFFDDTLNETVTNLEEQEEKKIKDNKKEN